MSTYCHLFLPFVHKTGIITSYIFPLKFAKIFSHGAMEAWAPVPDFLAISCPVPPRERGWDAGMGWRPGGGGGYNITWAITDGCLQGSPTLPWGLVFLIGDLEFEEMETWKPPLFGTWACDSTLRHVFILYESRGSLNSWSHPKKWDQAMQKGKSQDPWFNRETSHPSNSRCIWLCLPVCMPTLWPSWWCYKVSAPMLISTPHMFMNPWHWVGHWMETMAERPGCWCVVSHGPEGKRWACKEPWFMAEMMCCN